MDGGVKVEFENGNYTLENYKSGKLLDKKRYSKQCYLLTE
jgi:hypothetical protein